MESADVSSPGPLLPTPRRLDNLNCCLVHEHKPQSEPYSPTRRLREATLWFSRENSNPAALSGGL